MTTGGKMVLVALLALLAPTLRASAAEAGGRREAMARPAVPAGTQVVLAFDQAVSSKTAKPGETIRFRVANDVTAGGRVVIKKGEPVTGVIAKVEKSERYGVSAKMRIALNPVRSVSGQMVRLQPRTEGKRVGQRTGEAGAATAAGAIVAGPVGLVGGYFVSGKTVTIKPGDKLDTEVARESDPELAAGTQVVLVFDQAVSSRTAKVGDTIRLHVADDVMVGKRAAIRKGTPVTGVIATVEKRQRYGVNASMRIALNPVETTSGRLVPLEPRTEGAKVGEKTGQAGAATAAGAVVLGPVGLVGGYFISGKTVSIKPGDKLDTEVGQPQKMTEGQPRQRGARRGR